MDGTTHPYRDGRHRSGGRPVYPLHGLPASVIGVLIDAVRRETGGLLRFALYPVRRERYADGGIEREEFRRRRDRHGP